MAQRMSRPDSSLASRDQRCRRAVSRLRLGAITAILIAVSGGQAYAAGTANVSVRGAFSDGYGSFSVVVADSRPGSKLVLYINRGEPQKVIVTPRHRAIFRYVELEGSGELSFAEVRTRNHGRHYLAPLRYVRYFEATEGRVALASTEFAQPAAPNQEPPPNPAPVPPPTEPQCLNGTYINSEGNTVCKPEESPTGPPAGATARCRDGTYSFSQHRSGTCSYHGGVAEWLA
jgi:Protein of unknown function (DUF3761)